MRQLFRLKNVTEISFDGYAPMTAEQAEKKVKEMDKSMDSLQASIDAIHHHWDLMNELNLFKIM